MQKTIETTANEWGQIELPKITDEICQAGQYFYHILLGMKEDGYPIETTQLEQFVRAWLETQIHTGLRKLNRLYDETYGVKPM